MLKKTREKGIPLRALNYVLIGIAVIVAIALIYINNQVSDGYQDMREATESYVSWQDSALDLQAGTSYLSEQVRCYVMTGERQYLNDYFEETTVTRRRGRALDAIGEELAGTEAYKALEAALKQSSQLMVQELYAMRLSIAARGYNIKAYPEMLRRVTMKWEDTILSPEEKMAKAQELVFGTEYKEKAAAISENTEICMAELIQVMNQRQAEASENLYKLLQIQRVLIVVLMLAAALISLMTTVLIIWPLRRGVLHIRTRQTIPVQGSKEYRFLAETYNHMFEASRKHTEKLTYEATHDALTEIYNRNGYEFLCEQIDFSSVALLLFDVDKFKDFNDTYGHLVGDRVLCRVAEVLNGSFRARDHVCRIGGDEFVVIMRDVGAGAKDHILEKIKEMNDLLMNPKDDLPKISISAGVAFGGPETTSDDVFRAADEALYNVKKRGGHDCEFAGTV